MVPPAWAAPVAVALMAAVEILPERRMASVSSAVLVLVLAWLSIGFGFCLKFNLAIPAGGSGALVGLAGLAMGGRRCQVLCPQRQDSGGILWSVAVVVIAGFQVADSLAGPLLRPLFPLGLYSLTVFLALQVYSLLETSYPPGLPRPADRPAGKTRPGRSAVPTPETPTAWPWPTSTSSKGSTTNMVTMSATRSSGWWEPPSPPSSTAGPTAMGRGIRPVLSRPDARSRRRSRRGSPVRPGALPVCPAAGPADLALGRKEEPAGAVA